MKERESHLLLRLLLAALALFAGWRYLGPVGLALFSPLAGLVLARPLLEHAARSFGRIKEAALHDRRGRYFAFKGVPLDIEEDEAGFRWLKTVEVRRVLPSFPRDGVLLRLGLDGLSPFAPGKAQDLRIKAETLDAVLADSRQTTTIKFRNWLRKEIIFPADKARAHQTG